MKKEKFSFNILLQNNKLLLIISLIISLSVWVYMSLGSSNDTNRTLSNIPIQIELSDKARESGLQIFSSDEHTASVTITGNRTILGSITESDVTVIAAANGIDAPGNYDLSVSASKANQSLNFQITSAATPSTINVVVDYFHERTFQIQPNVVYGVNDGYHAYTSLSSESIVISGPQTEISKISKVSAVGEIKGKIDSTVSLATKLIIYDENNNELPTNLFTLDVTDVTATVTVLPEKTVNVKPVYVNKPSGLQITNDMISIEPASILLAGPNDVIKDLSSVNLEALDFSTLKNEKKTFPSLGIEIPIDCKNLSNSTTAKLTLDLSMLSSKTFDVEKFNVKGLDDKYKSEVTQNSITVTVIGPKEQIDKLDKDKITAVIETTEFNGTVGSVQMPVRFNFNGADSCWAYGTYKANLTISEK